MAERVGFEPTNGLLRYTLSRRACSTTPAPLREVGGPRPKDAAGGACQSVGFSQSDSVSRDLYGGGPSLARLRLVAERAGFEPAKLAFTRFRDERLQPLGHLSVGQSTRPSTHGTVEVGAEVEEAGRAPPFVAVRRENLRWDTNANGGGLSAS